MLKALITGEGAPEELAELAKRSLRPKRPALAEALTGRVTAHHRFMLDSLLRHIEFLDDAVATYDRHIETLTGCAHQTLLDLGAGPLSRTSFPDRGSTPGVGGNSLRKETGW